MELVRHTDPASYLDAAGPLLLRAEAANNLILGLATRARDDPEAWPDPYLATIHDGGVIAAALRTPPHNLLLTSMPADAAALVARDLVAHELPGVAGDDTAARAFADLHCHHTGFTYRPRFSMRIYQLERARPPSSVPGRWRAAGVADVETLARWWDAFVDDVGIPRGDTPPAQQVRARIEAGTMFVWDDGGPVSMAACAGPTPNGIRVNMVYTPDDLRGRGYASACVAATSQHLLDQGRRFCFLYADLANPTSNSLYLRIGYEPVCNAVHLDFLPAGA